jgi:hypothetical protein
MFISPLPDYVVEDFYPKVIATCDVNNFCLREKTKSQRPEKLLGK